MHSNTTEFEVMQSLDMIQSHQRVRPTWHSLSRSAKHISRLSYFQNNQKKTEEKVCNLYKYGYCKFKDSCNTRLNIVQKETVKTKQDAIKDTEGCANIKASHVLEWIVNIFMRKAQTTTKLKIS